MLIVLFVVHVLIALALIGVIMLQKSEGGALGMGGGGMSGFMTGRSTANLLTRTTAILAVAFFATSIILVKLNSPSGAPSSTARSPGLATRSPRRCRMRARRGCAKAVAIRASEVSPGGRVR